MNKDHPYKDYEKLKIWKVLRKGIRDLESNQDLEAKTAERYIVGYLIKVLDNADILDRSEAAPRKSTSKARARAVPKVIP